MKARSVTILFLSFICLLFGTVSVTHASTYITDVCWQADSGNFYRFAVSDMGNYHYFLNGKVVVDNTWIGTVYGNAEVNGNFILLSMTGTSADSTYVYVSISNVWLSVSTLNGEAYVTVEKFNRSNATYTKYVRVENLTLASCP